MDIDVCLECRGPTSLLRASLRAAASRTERTWRECPGCGWESLYQDVVHPLDEHPWAAAG
ncbi:hypothetical protein [Aquipuribacter hungaricus]|uniref:Small CPxCG-related zinc finger protein n=1 Tax=Aquipuribacter hungaricus TaxID=545624 RepID=A0ABV7WH34_9MICO